MITRKIYANSGTYNLCEFVLNCGVCTVSDIIEAMSSSYNFGSSVQRLKDQLVQTGYLEELPDIQTTGKRYVHLTKEGTEYLIHLDESRYYHNYHISPTKIASMNLKRSQGSTIKAKLYAANVVFYNREKPPLMELYRYIIDGKIEHYEKQYDANGRILPSQFPHIEDIDIDDALARGIYYNSDEVKNFVCEVMKDEERSSSRTKGIIINSKNIYLIYEIENKLMQNGLYYYDSKKKSNIYFAAESKIIDSLQKLFEDKYSHLCAIYFSRKYLQYVGYVLGTSKGVISDKMRGAVKYSTYSARTTCFNSVFFVPKTHEEYPSLALILKLDRNEMLTKGLAHFQNDKENLAENIADTFCAKTEDNEPVLFLPAAEAMTLYSARNLIDSNTPVIIYTYSHLADSVAHCLGPRVKAIYDIKTKEQFTDILEYDEAGRLLDEKVDHNKKKEDETAKKITVSVRIDQETYDKIKREAEEKKSSINKIMIEKLKGR